MSQVHCQNNRKVRGLARWHSTADNSKTLPWESTWNYCSSWIGHHLNYQTSQVCLIKWVSAWGSSNLLHQNESASSTHQFSEVCVCQLTNAVNEAFTSALNLHSECSADEHPRHLERLTTYYRPNVMLIKITIVLVLYFKTAWTKQQFRATFHFVKTQSVS
jgi:hypothetical protein